MTVVGKVADQALPECPAGVISPLCTQGHVIGVLSGTYDFALASQVPAPDIPTVGLFTAKSTIHTKKGDLFLAEAGSVDGVTGKLADLWTITGGTGKWEGATGQVFAVGAFNFVSGTGEVLYSGEVCTPK